MYVGYTWFARGVQALKTSNSLMDLRACGTGEEATKPVTIQRQSSFSRKAASLKRFSRYVTANEPTNCPVSLFNIVYVYAVWD